MSQLRYHGGTTVKVRGHGLRVVQFAVDVLNRSRVSAGPLRTPVELRFGLDRTDRRSVGISAFDFDTILPPGRWRGGIGGGEAQRRPAILHQRGHLPRDRCWLRPPAHAQRVRRASSYSAGNAPVPHRCQATSRRRWPAGWHRPLLPGRPSLSPSNDQAVPSKRATPLSVPIHKQPVAVIQKAPDVPGQQAALQHWHGRAVSAFGTEQPLRRPEPGDAIGAEGDGAEPSLRSPLVEDHEVSTRSFHRTAPVRIPTQMIAVRRRADADPDSPGSAPVLTSDHRRA